MTKRLAEKAAAAAESIEGQLNESVGASPDLLNELSKKSRASNASNNVPISSVISESEDPFYDDDFYEDGADSFDVDMHEDASEKGEALEPALEPVQEMEHDDNDETSVPTEPALGVQTLADGAGNEEDDDSAVDHNDGEIQEEGLYDDDDEEEEVDFVDFEEESPQQDHVPVEIPIANGVYEELPVQVDQLQLEFSEVAVAEAESEEEAVQNDEIKVIEEIQEPMQETDHYETSYPVAVEQIESKESYDDEEEFPLEETEDSEPIDDLQAIEATPQIEQHSQAEHPSIQRTDSENSIYVSKEEALELNSNLSFQLERNIEMETLQSQILELQNQLAQREGQLESKANQITTMVEMYEQEKRALEAKVKETKEEAKKRISKAKEKVDAIQNKLSEANTRASSAGSTSSDQSEMIVALREEGEKLARKQSEMEQSVREARGDMRDLKKALEKESTAKEKALEKNAALETDLKDTKAELSAAKQKGGLADKLDSDLLVAREEREKNASIILGLEAKLKESKSRNSELKKDMEHALKETVSQLQHETTSIRNEKDTILQDLEAKLRTSEREANMREDSLRHEVAELRKRWQEAVRRCDALSIDLQQSSAPLMRQLESTERQNRARASAWAELETKLRSDLEENVIQNEKLLKEKNELEAEIKKIGRSLQGKESELIISQTRLEELNAILTESSNRSDSAVGELEALKVEFANFEQMIKANESKARTEIMNNIRDSEEGYNDQIESLEVELRQERDKRTALEGKIQEMMNIAPNSALANTGSNATQSPRRNLGSKENQAAILQGTLLGLDSNGDDNDEEGDEQESIASGSFAFIEQLSQALKASKLERATLRKQLDDSEERRAVLENESVKSNEATKSLPLLEAQVVQLTQEVAEKDMEIQALREDINEVRQMYRTQLNVLLEEKTSNGTSPTTNGAQVNINKAANKDTKPVVPTSFGGMRTF